MASNIETPSSDITAREHLAFTIIKYAGIGLSALIVLIIVFALYYGSGEHFEDSRGLLLTIFNAVLPLIGTWIGTVLAFYFTRENFSAASQETSRLVEALSSQKLKSIPVDSVMLPAGKIVGAEKLTPTKGEKDVKVADLQARLKPPVNRIPVLDQNGAIRYVLHDSMIYKDIATHGVEVGVAPDKRDRTLEDMLADKDFKAIVSALAVLAPTATLADAKSKMDTVANCRDVFVTDNGGPTEAVRGWVTDRDIAVSARA